MTPTVIFEAVLGMVRHLLTFGGGALITGGIATQTEMDAGIGAVMALIGLGWSWYRKWKRSESNA